MTSKSIETEMKCFKSANMLKFLQDIVEQTSHLCCIKPLESIHFLCNVEEKLKVG